jgi:hypothetical protein
MDRFADVETLQPAIDEEQALEDVFERFPETTPAEVMALADDEDSSSSGVDPTSFEAFLEDPPLDRPGVGADGSTADGEPFDVTADELFGE